MAKQPKPESVMSDENEAAPPMDVKEVMAAADAVGTKAHEAAVNEVLAKHCVQLATVVQARCPAAAGKIMTAARLLRSC